MDKFTTKMVVCGRTEYRVPVGDRVILRIAEVDGCKKLMASSFDLEFVDASFAPALGAVLTLTIEVDPLDQDGGHGTVEDQAGDRS